MYLFDLSIEYRVIIGISAMVLLFAGFLISFVTSQRKKIQYNQELQLLHEQQRQLLLEQNNLLEQRVQARTTELNQQKEALQTSLSHLKATQIRLVQQEKLASLGELTAGIAHEIQNPLNFVNNFSEVCGELIEELKDEIRGGHTDDALGLSDELTKNIEKIAKHGIRASRIVKAMLEHSHSQSGERQPTSINALADEYLKLAYHGLRAKNPAFQCELITTFDPQMGSVKVVSQEIGRVLLNLFNNAFYAVTERAGKEPGHFLPVVTVSTARQENQVIIRVKDNGTGIPTAVQAKLFQPFFTTKPTGEGTGLGLSLSYDIVTKGHGGTMEMASTEGEGAEFIVTLPR
ncbi:sensor histidine kinase [Spirosoma spitsbergense]|uniref:sensor histidine kinase n=1 Tax=Spirosoma spitsbergense TaxID=431554 RepID=UPI00037699F2|nr:ATP-binding protein [Spirosoma spitsbergense]